MGKRLKEANAFQKITIFAIIFILCLDIYSTDGEYIMSRLGYDARSTGIIFQNILVNLEQCYINQSNIDVIVEDLL